MSITRRIRLGTDLITFFDLSYWGLAAETSYEEWIRIVEADPHHYFERMFDGCVEAGVEGVEFAPPPGGLATALSAYGSAAKLGSALRSRNLTVSSSFTFGAPLIMGAIENPAFRSKADDEIRRHADFLAELGCGLIVLGAVPRASLTEGDPNGIVPRSDLARIAEQIDKLGSAAAPAGVRLALHTDAYSVCSRLEDVCEILANTSPDTVSLCLDAGHVTLDSGDAVEMLRSHVERVPIMHWKDCIGPLNAADLRGPIMDRHAVMLTHFRILGNGIVDWREWQRILRDANWSGWAIAEIDMSPDPIGEVRAGIDFFERELAPIHK
ncbi:sugar phosphate isomerase/epimerase family protein [Paenarthrobacter ureafaciens]|uniref:sugar phosphate isomerase/epimerase family protein n=1 Tax=Paenarthrobacter ureafaciens TaxID=37931 RepID=UPI002DBEA724|nr:sugar phosphate isomerase/epimerase family protein [Paenarthrobacter ureafaciens]MEC3853661.1 sugar phosphate isomerase/epimerase family protein [Paenarthrobacter ureafaciens]